MSERKIILPQLYDAGGDTSKQWKVFYSYKDPSSGKMKRFSVSEGLNKTTDYQERMRVAQALITKYTQKLEAGYNPFKHGKYVYQDVVEPTTSTITIKGLDQPLIKCLSDTLERHQKTIKKTTFRSYKGHFIKFREYLEECKSEDIKINDFKRMDAYIFLMQVELHNKTRKLIQGSIKRLYNLYIKQNELELDVKNPFTGLDLPRAVTTEALKAFDDQEQEKIKSYLITNKNKYEEVWLVVQLIYYCFLRPNEIRQIKIEDIRPTKGKIYLRAEITKNNKEAMISLPPMLMEQIKNWVKYRAKEEYIFGGRKGRGHEYHRKKHTEVLKFLGLKTKRKSLYSWKKAGMNKHYMKYKDPEALRKKARHGKLDEILAYLTLEGLIESHMTQIPEMGINIEI